MGIPSRHTLADRELTEDTDHTVAVHREACSCESSAPSFEHLCQLVDAWPAACISPIEHLADEGEERTDQPGIQTGDIQPDRPPFVTLRLDPCGLKEPSERDIESFSLVREPRQQVDEADVVLHEDRIPEAARGAERDARRFPFYDLLAPQVVVRGLDPGVPVDHQCSSSSGTKSRSEEHTSELQSRGHLVCRLLLEKKKQHKELIIHYYIQ